MPEYIEREALRAEALRLTESSEFAFDYCFPYWQFSKCIKEAPAADVQTVVHCGECEHRIYREIEDNTIGGCEIFGCALPTSFYCSYGAKMDKEDET